MRGRSATVGFVLLLGAVLPGLAGAAEESACVACHGNPEFFGAEGKERIRSFQEESVHAAAGVSCHDCHGGNPDPGLAEDVFGAMDADFGPNPYRGAPTRVEQPEFCGHCHSDAAYMKRFGARPRTDQVRLYWTSGHGRALRAGDDKAAVCGDCHGLHDIRPTARTSSRVHPTRVAGTCGGCHGDASLMAGYGLPSDVLVEWQASVHATALLEKNDLSAPTCNDCHGNHGAAPPGAASVAATCGTCHSREADLFRASPKAAALEVHATFTESVDDIACSDCHVPPHPAAGLDGVSLHGCVACHDNHAVLSSRVTLLSPLAETPCAYCHPEDWQPIGTPLAPEPGLRFQAVRDSLLEHARELGLEGSDRFDWLLAEARRLPAHRRRTADNGVLEPQVSSLMRRLRVAPTRESHADPRGDGRVEEPVRRCGSCHAPDGRGYAVSSDFQSAIQEVSRTAARAERILLAAERGGVAVGEAQQRLDEAIDATVDLVALVHGFSSDPEAPFTRRHQEALDRAEGAGAAARAALAELGARRQGLLVVLGLIVIAVVLVALKVRQLSGDGERSGSA